MLHVSAAGQPAGSTNDSSMFKCARRFDGNDEGLIELAKKNALAIGAGHSFIIFLKDAYPGECSCCPGWQLLD